MSKNKPKGKICYYCGGRGKVIIKQFNAESNLICEKEQTCITCGGRGWVKNAR